MAPPPSFVTAESQHQEKLEKERMQPDKGVLQKLSYEYEVGPPGYEHAIRWNPVPGADRAEVAEASIEIGPVSTIDHENLGEMLAEFKGGHLVVSTASPRFITKLKLDGLQYLDGGDWIDLRSRNDLGYSGPRLVVSIPDGAGGWTPLYAVPEVSARNVLPAMFLGASFSSGVLVMPGDFAVEKMRISLVKEEYPEDFEVLSIQLAGGSGVTGWAARLPRDLTLTDPQENVSWSFPGDMAPRSPRARVDLRAGLEGAMNAALPAGDPPEAVFSLMSAVPARARAAAGACRGALLRNFPGVLTTKISGLPAAMNFDETLSENPLAGERSTPAKGDFVVRYDGLRILPSVSDELPAGDGGVGGSIVTESPVLRALPPAGWGDLPPARVGLIGRASEPCDLSVCLKEKRGAEAGASLGPPGAATLTESDRIGVVWIDFPEGTSFPTGPTFLSVEATRGTFLWAADPDPLIRLAVRDPDPGGRPLFLDGKELLLVDEAERVEQGFTFPGEAFRTRPPVFESDLFLTIEVADLALRYPR